MHILILGTNSYIGKHLAEHLQQFPADYSVCSISQRDDHWKSMDFSAFDAIVDCVGIAHVDNGRISKNDSERYYKVNRDLAVTSAQKAKQEGAKQFIFMSSAIIYGKQQHISIDSQPAPESAYGDSKWQAELKLRELEDDSFRVATIRPPMIYGPDCKGNYPRLSRLAQKTNVFPYVNNRRSMLYVENLCKFIRLLIENNDHGTFWPQNNEYVCTSNMVKTIADVHNKKMALIHGATPFVRLAGKFSNLPNKIFGDFYYDQTLSAYKDNYQVCNFNESIRRTEKIENNDC